MEKDFGRIVLSGFRELISLAGRLGEKIKDKYFWTYTEMEQAVGYLLFFRDALKKQEKSNTSYQQIFGESGDFFEIKHFKRGFNAKSITFKTIVRQEVKRWVLKIGHRISPVIDFGDPSNPDYYKKYKQDLEVLRKKIMQHKELVHLLPEPQEVIWAVLTEEGNKFGTTLLLQPFLHVMKPNKIQKKLTDEQRIQLIAELQAFKKLCEGLVKDHKLHPDLLGEGNLEIVEKNGEYHLMLLDMGLVNLLAPLPITHAVMHFASLQTIYNVEKLIKKIL